MRKRLTDPSSNIPTKREAIRVLAIDSSPENLPHLLLLLDTPELAGIVIPLLSRYNERVVADELFKFLMAQ